MKNYIFVLGFLGLMGCSVTEAQYEDRNQTLLCSTCETITCDGDVEVDADDDEASVTVMPCDFVSENADACLGGEWTCDDSQGFEVVVMPDICADVYDCHQSEEDTGPAEDTDPEEDTATDE